MYITPTTTSDHNSSISGTLSPPLACQVRKLGMMAGGTGITPMLQVISAVMREGGGMGRSKIEMSLIFANKSEDDILLRDMIEKLVRQTDVRYCSVATAAVP